MSASKFSKPFMMKSPLKMKESPLGNHHNEDPKKIIGEQTYEFEKDKPSGNYVAGLSLDPDLSPEPSNTDDRLVITPEQKKKMEKNGVMTSNFIEQMDEMNVKKDSVSGGKNFYSIKNKSKK
tara:strand:+ start:117 stop:482 length:366 start_codon:yes stop_codon:yes gene_type:complete